MKPAGLSGATTSALDRLQKRRPDLANMYGWSDIRRRLSSQYTFDDPGFSPTRTGFDQSDIRSSLVT